MEFLQRLFLVVAQFARPHRGGVPVNIFVQQRPIHGGDFQFVQSDDIIGDLLILEHLIDGGGQIAGGGDENPP